MKLKSFNPFSHKGKLSRSQYNTRLLVATGLSFITFFALILLGSLFPKNTRLFVLFAGLGIIGLTDLLYYLALAERRIRDIGYDPEIKRYTEVFTDIFLPHELLFSPSDSRGAGNSEKEEGGPTHKESKDSPHDKFVTPQELNQSANKDTTGENQEGLQ